MGQLWLYRKDTHLYWQTGRYNQIIKLLTSTDRQAGIIKSQSYSPVLTAAAAAAAAAAAEAGARRWCGCARVCKLASVVVTTCPLLSARFTICPLVTWLTGIVRMVCVAIPVIYKNLESVNATLFRNMTDGSNKSTNKMQQFHKSITRRSYVAQHVSGVSPPISGACDCTRSLWFYR